MSGDIDGAGNPNVVERRTKSARRRQRDQDAALVALMSHQATRSWVYDLLTRCQMFQTSFSKSALEMAFNEGARNVGLRLTADLMRLCPDDYVKMLREQQETEHVDAVRENAEKRASGGEPGGEFGDPGDGTGPEPGLGDSGA